MAGSCRPSWPPDEAGACKHCPPDDDCRTRRTVGCDTWCPGGHTEHCTGKGKKKKGDRLIFSTKHRTRPPGDTYLGPGLHAPHALAALVVAVLSHRRLLVVIAGTARCPVLVATCHLAALHGRVPAVAAGLVAQRPLALGPLRTGLVAAALERVGHLQAVGGALWIIHDIESFAAVATGTGGVASATGTFGLCLSMAAQRTPLGNKKIRKIKFPLFFPTKHKISSIKTEERRLWLLKYLIVFLILWSHCGRTKGSPEACAFG